MELKDAITILEKNAESKNEVFESIHAKELELLWTRIVANIIKSKNSLKMLSDGGFVNDALEVYIISYGNSNDVKERAKMTFLNTNSRIVERYLDRKFITATELTGYKFHIRTDTKQDSENFGLNSYTTFCTLSIDLLKL